MNPIKKITVFCQHVDKSIDVGNLITINRNGRLEK